MATSTPFEKNTGDKKSMPTLNVSVINRCSLSTVAEVEHEESLGSRLVKNLEPQYFELVCFGLYLKNHDSPQELARNLKLAIYNVDYPGS